MARNLTFTVNGRVCHPNYSGDISFVIARGNDERYYRTTLNTDLLFLDGSGDYSWIRSQAFDTEFKVVITDDSGFVWRGVFYKTDCTFSEDDRSVKVKPDTDDLYKRILERMDDKVDVIKLAPASTEVRLKKRAILQTYVVANGNVGDKVVTNWLGNMTWEEDANPPTDRSESQMETFLTNTCSFAKKEGIAVVAIRGINALEGLTGVDGIYTSSTRVQPVIGTWRYDGPNGNYVTIEHSRNQISSRCITTMTLFKANGAQIMTNAITGLSTTEFPYPSMNAYGTYAVYDSYMRWLFDKENVSGSVYKRVEGDLTEYNLNYRFVKSADDAIADVEFYGATSAEPTEYGKDEFGMYFEYPDRNYQPTTPYFPIARSTWSPMSVWLQTLNNPSYSGMDTVEQAAQYEVPYSIKDTYSLAEIIKVILHEIASEPVNGVTISHEGTQEYSGWLYGSEVERKPYIVPNSNVKKTYYTNPAQKGEMTLRQVLDMLRDCFNVYWYITDDGRFCLEHISSFTAGVARASVVADLASMMSPRNLRKLAFGQNTWTYDKNTLPERVEFAFSEKQTDPFNGCVLQYQSNYVQKGMVDKITVSNFSADVDYIIEMPGSVSDDGWTVLLPKTVGNALEVPVGIFTFDRKHLSVQNAAMCFYNLWFDSLRYNLCARRYRFVDIEYNEESERGAMSVKRIRKQTVTFPSAEVPSPYGLVRTGLSSDGDDGEILDMTYTPLSERIQANLYFDTEK